MLEIIYGNNRDICLELLNTRIGDFEKKGYQVSRLVLFDQSDEQKIIEEILGTDLFITKKLIILSDVLENDSILSVITNHAEGVDDNKYIIVFETDIATPIIKKFEKKKIKIHHHALTKERDTEIFKLTDAVASRDIKKSWLIFHELLDSGMTAHQMIGMLWWQMKTLLLVASSKTNPGLKPFVYTKSKKALEKFTLPQLQEKTLGLLSVYHQGHLGDDIDVLLEQWILK